jgi:hypothetical protein
VSEARPRHTIAHNSELSYADDKVQVYSTMLDGENNANVRETLSNALEQYKGDAAFQRQEAQGGRA